MYMATIFLNKNFYMVYLNSYNQLDKTSLDIFSILPDFQEFLQI